MRTRAALAAVALAAAAGCGSSPHPDEAAAVDVVEAILDHDIGALYDLGHPTYRAGGQTRAGFIDCFAPDAADLADRVTGHDLQASARWEAESTFDAVPGPVTYVTVDGTVTADLIEQHASWTLAIDDGYLVGFLGADTAEPGESCWDTP